MILIGTSGFYYKHWLGKFYPKGLPSSKWLHYYSQVFDTVELNVTFYRLPTKKTFSHWFAETPPGFKFTLKGSRLITHYKKLINVDKSVQIFFDTISPLQDKILAILWQFPNNFLADAVRLESFLKTLRNFPYISVFEFRNETWFSEDIYNLLKKYNASFVLADTPNLPKNEVFTSDVIYLRFHGGKSLPVGEYSNKELADISKKVSVWSKKHKIMIYFNNDFGGFAVKNALELIDLIGEENNGKQNN